VRPSPALVIPILSTQYGFDRDMMSRPGQKFVIPCSANRIQLGTGRPEKNSFVFTGSVLRPNAQKWVFGWRRAPRNLSRATAIGNCLTAIPLGHFIKSLPRKNR
jgi:hypothetical protein